MNDFINQALLGPLELLGRQVLTELPYVLAMGIILLGGLITAWAFGSSTERLFRVIGFDHLCDRLGMNAALLRGGVKTDPSRIVGRSIYWTVLMLASIAALGALNLTPINQFAQSLLAYVPHLVTGDQPADLEQGHVTAVRVADDAVPFVLAPAVEQVDRSAPDPCGSRRPHVRS